jgi:hypothetical protein
LGTTGGNYRRVSEHQLQEILAHAEQLSSFLYPDDEPDAASALDIDKSWHTSSTTC